MTRTQANAIQDCYLVKRPGDRHWDSLMGRKYSNGTVAFLALMGYVKLTTMNEANIAPFAEWGITDSTTVVILTNEGREANEAKRSLYS